MKKLKYILLATGVAGSASWVLAQAPIDFPETEPGQYVHDAPDLDALMQDETINPELKEVILKGRDMFMNTQKYRGEYVFNDQNCRSCHLGEGGMNWSAPVWPAATTLPDFRGKNGHVNSLEERIAGCFSFSMNGIAPAYGSDDMLAMVAYHQWLATGAPVYERDIAGRGFNHLGNEIPDDLDYDTGRTLYEDNCAICHGDDGQGRKVGEEVVFPPLWGDGSYNWGAGMTRLPTAASFIQLNMPLGKPMSLTEREAWELANYINSQERPQDPRYTGDAEETREKYYNFHQFTHYGTEVNGVLLGQHDNTGEKPVLRPENLRPRHFD